MEIEHVHIERGSRAERERGEGGSGVKCFSRMCAFSLGLCQRERVPGSPPPLIGIGRGRTRALSRAAAFLFFCFNSFASVSALRVKVPESEVVLFPQVSAGDIAQAAEFRTAGTEEQHGKRRRREENLS